MKAASVKHHDVCAQEAIHTPGSIQSFGVLLVLDTSGHIVQVSSNSAILFGQPPEALLNVHFEKLFPVDVKHRILEGLSHPDAKTGFELGPIVLPRHNQNWQTRLVSMANHFLLEFWPEVYSLPLSFSVTDLVRQMVSGESLEDFSESLCDFLRQNTGYSRVMVYRFDSDWNGQVIAESRESGLPPYLGLYYPASDIPPQARELYHKARVRVLADAQAAPSPLVPRINPVTRGELDLSLSYLRTMSPVHCEYLHNMQVRATQVTSILHDGKLWGLIACHHYEPLNPRREWIHASETASQLLASCIQLLQAQVRSRSVSFTQSLLNKLPKILAQSSSLGAGLIDEKTGFMEIMSADGLTILHRGEQFNRGVIPSQETILNLKKWLESSGERLVYTDRLGQFLPEMKNLGPIAGLLALRIPNSLQGWVLWFRIEQSLTVTWAGAPRHITDPAFNSQSLSPRKSFDAWVEKVQGRSRPWSEVELATASEVIRPNFLEVVATTHQQQEETLRRHQSILYEQVHDAIIMTDLGGIVTFWNDGATRTLGWTSQEMVGRSVLDRIPLADRPAAAAIMAEVREGKPFVGRYRDTRKNGQPVWLDIRLGRVQDDLGQFIGIMGCYRDVTAEKITEDQLRLKQAIIQNARDNILVTEAEPTDLPGPRIIYANTSLLDATGYTLDEVIGQTPRMFQGLRTDRAVLNRIRQYLKKWRPIREELINYRKDGSEFWVELDICPLADDSGWYTHWIGVQRDITERKLAEAALRESEAHFRMLAECLPDSVLIVDANVPQVPYCMVYCSLTAATTLGYDPSELYGQSLSMALAPEDYNLVASRVEKVKPGLTITFQEQHLHKNGQRIPVEVSVVAITWKGRPAMLWVIRDITQRREAEQALRQSEANYRLLADNCADVITLHDLDTRCLYASPSCQRLTGHTPDQLLNTLIEQAVHPDDLQAVRDSFAKKLLGESTNLEWRIKRVDGSYIWVESASKPIFNERGEVTSVIVSTRDITPRRQLEEQVRQAQKLEAIGQLAGGVAHDFNNLLTIITGFSELILADTSPESPHHQLLSDMLRATERGASLTHQLLAFSRQQMMRVEVFNPAIVTRETLRMLARLLGEDVQIRSHLDGDVGLLKADPSQFEQVLMNLAVNARDAMPLGGTLTVEVRRVTLETTTPQIPADATLGDYIQLVVEDTGTGMTPEVQAKLFEPFFTTKPIGKGTGLGLATVYGIIRQLGGFITVKSELDRGSRFEAYFPAFLEPSTVDDLPTVFPDGNDPAIAENNFLILLVEDDSPVRFLTCQVLEHHGFQVLAADSGQAAIELCDSLTAPPDLMLTDVVMPGMSGRELAEVLGNRFPRLRIVFLSGYTSDTIIRHGVEQDRVFFLQKPYSPQQLVQFTHEVLKR